MSQIHILNADGQTVPVGPDNPIPMSGGGGMEPTDIVGAAPATVTDNGDGTVTVGVEMGTTADTAAVGNHTHTIASTTGTLALNRGGTGATSAAAARTNLGLNMPQPAIADLSAAPTTEDFNTLLAALRSAGVIQSA